MNGSAILLPALLSFNRYAYPIPPRFMRILDLDLDFFLDGITWKYGVGDRFPDEGSYPPWSEERVRRFLEDQCGLSKESPVPGKVVTTHDEVLWEWLELSSDGQKWDIVHVDAHGDLGYRDSAYRIR